MPNIRNPFVLQALYVFLFRAESYSHYESGCRFVQVVHDRSRCIFGVDQFTSLKQGLQDTYTWAAGPDLPARLQSTPEFKAEILEQGMPAELQVRSAAVRACESLQRPAMNSKPPNFA